MANLQNTKRRIKSVDSTKKITKAMELVASAKLRKAKIDFTQSVDVRDFVVENMSAVITEIAKQTGKHKYIETQGEKTLYVVIGGDMGLSGGYNINVAKEAFLDSKPGDLFYCIGKKPVAYLKTKGAEMINVEAIGKEYITEEFQVVEANDVNFMDTYFEVNIIRAMFQNGLVDKVKLAQTNFVNSVTFTPKVTQILPVENTFTELMAPFEINGDSDSLIDDLLKDYLASYLFTAKLEGRVCEYASSRLAMENATDNAEELIEQLLLEYNRARQANITQELTEIVAGADAI